MNTLQKLVFAGNYGQPQELFVRGNAKIIENSLVNCQGVITFDTYFNMFIPGFWLKNTHVNKVSLKLKVAGSGIATIYRVSQNGTEDKKLSEVSFDNERPEFIDIIKDENINSLGEFVYLKVQSSNALLYEGEYYGDSEGKKIDVACCICTYKREKEITRNIDLFNRFLFENEDVKKTGSVSVIIADNGKTLPKSLNNQYVHVFPNKNYGGSAGFTRCMIEAAIKNKEYSHLILMDDDAITEPFVILRTMHILAHLKEEYQKSFLGGGLLSKEKMHLQMENGAYFTLFETYFEKRGLDLTKREQIIANAKENKINYCGWFYCSIPASYITASNLPLPLFIHGDDQEYGVRNLNGIIMSNGICIWHPSPQGRMRAYMNYYDCRNDAIIAAVHNKGMSAKSMLRLITKKVMSKAVVYKYEEAWYAIRGFNDFYKGAEWFVNTDAEKLNMELLSLKEYNAAPIPDGKIVYTPHPQEKVKKIYKALNWFVPSNNKNIYYNIYEAAEYIPIYRSRKIYLIDEPNNRMYILKKSYKLFFSIVEGYLKLVMTVLFTHKKVWSAWINKTTELQSLTFWENYLKQDNIQN